MTEMYLSSDRLDSIKLDNTFFYVLVIVSTRFVQKKIETKLEVLYFEFCYCTFRVGN